VRMDGLLNLLKLPGAVRREIIWFLKWNKKHLDPLQGSRSLAPQNCYSRDHDSTTPHTIGQFPRST
jgi:hypothetical protein